ncbi:hypothetical protein BCR32DRAFT_281462 [Anaeromyces robustus]|uniref:Chitin-binding type-1 domain-containing protein n=1 Tax=Anaeromyces robustus TaxID=1754192 RepID=A0A1Y1X1R2_9FUNG|nr:hypothetical protein BCR32DRAFT_281462 [Anaeromyces robustus]|eukprot:ORX79356.1 hypothetical protein BCR32DRAFT_281462 [Anaeromyces robustus]
MKLYLIVLLNITLINNVFGSNWYYSVDDDIHIVANSKCNKFYRCNDFGLEAIVDHKKSTTKFFLSGCIDENGNAVSNIYSGKNPFDCKNVSNAFDNDNWYYSKNNKIMTANSNCSRYYKCNEVGLMEIVENKKSIAMNFLYECTDNNGNYVNYIHSGKNPYKMCKNFSSSIFDKDWYYSDNDKYIVANSNCNKFYTCEELGIQVSVNGKKSVESYFLTDCIDENGNVVSNIYSGKNPFKSCNYHTLSSLNLYDCRNSYKSGKSKNSYKIISKQNGKIKDAKYLTSSGTSGRILTKYGWCKYDSDRCGKDFGLHCHSNYCCSKYGYCGNTSNHCGKNCQSNFGKC